MIQKPKSVQLYQAEILAALAATGIRQTSPGGKARAFCDIVGDKMGELEARSYAAVGQTLLPYASGVALNFLGEMFGITRIARQDVTSSSTEDNFEFYVLRGTFGSINGGADITVPAGTRLFTASDNGQVYVTAADVVLGASENRVGFAANSLSVGEAGNAPAGVFVRHSFTNYADARYGTLLVTNNFGLVGGRDEEDDDSYRFRINLKLQSHGGAAEADLRLAVLDVPGIQDVVFTREAGSYTAYVYGISPLVPPSLLSMVQAELDKFTAWPLKGLAVSPDLLGVSLATTLLFVASTSPSDRAAAIASATAAAEDYINNLKVGEALVINEIADRLRNADPKIIDIGQPNKPLDEVFLWRARLDGTRYSRYLVGNYEPKTGERVMVETTTNAISLTAA